MSFQSSRDPRRRPIATGTGFSPSGRRTALGYWVPLAMTVGVATLGLAAWIWSERSDDDDEGDCPRDGEGRHGGFRDAPGPGGEEPLPVGPGGEYATATAADIRDEDEASVMARMQGALRRTPSPQQIFDGASKRVAAGVAAAGALMGGGLTSIREDDRGDFEDHSRWSEEVRSRANERSRQAAASMSGALPTRAPVADMRKKTVAIVVSSVSSQSETEDFSPEHAVGYILPFVNPADDAQSILSHLPEHVDPDTSRIFVLIYAPDLKRAIGRGSPSRPTMSITSSYSNIAPEEATASGELPTAEMSAVEPGQMDEAEDTSPFFKTLYTQAQTLVEKESMIMPFSTATGYVHLVRHLSPDIVYVQESLTGSEGDPVHHISGWVRQVVVVVGDEGGRGGLIDSDDESALAEKGERWWQKDGTTGIGKRIEVMDVLRTGDDWRRRVRGHD